MMSSNENQTKSSDCRIINITFAIINENSRRWLNPHVEKFQSSYPHIKVNLVTTNSTDFDEFVQKILDDHAENGTLFGFDGYETLAGWVGNFAQENAAVDLTHRIRTDNALSQQWTNILPFYRQGNGIFDNKPYMLPVDDNGYFMFYRRDLFERFNVSVPRTWDELQHAIEFFHGLKDDVKNMTYHGLCLNRRKECVPSSSFDIHLGTISQTLGTTQGSFVNSSTGELIAKDAMMKAVELMERTVPYSDPDDFLEDDIPNTLQCLSTKFTSGQCAVTYGIFNLVQGTVENLFVDLEMGVAPLPASDIVLDRVTGRLTSCSSSLCPFGVEIPIDNEKESIIVNYAPYYGSLGRVFGVSTWTSAERQDAVIKFATHVIASSDDDAIPDLKGRFLIVHPYQVSHLNETKWLEKNHSIKYVRPLLESFEKSSSENANIIPRIGVILTNYLNWLDDNISEYLAETLRKGSDGIEERRNTFVDKLREMLTTQVLNDSRFLESYQKSLGIYQKPATEMFIPDSLFITCIICGCLVLCLALWCSSYLQKNKLDEVVSAFHPNLLLFNCLGSCMIGIAIIFSALDDKRVGIDAASHACRIEPTLVILAQSMFLCSELAKVIFIVVSSRKRANGMLNRSDNVNASHLMKSSILTIMPAFIAVIVFLVLDKPKWDQDAYTDDDEVWGMCSATLSSSLSLRIVSYWFLVLIALILAIIGFSKYNIIQRQWISITLSAYLQAMVCCLPIFLYLKDNSVAFLTTRMIYYMIIAIIPFGIFMIPLTLRKRKTLDAIRQIKHTLLHEAKKLSDARGCLKEMDKKILSLLKAHPELAGKVVSHRKTQTRVKNTIRLSMVE